MKMRMMMFRLYMSVSQRESKQNWPPDWCFLLRSSVTKTSQDTSVTRTVMVRSVFKFSLVSVSCTRKAHVWSSRCSEAQVILDRSVLSLISQTLAVFTASNSETAVRNECQISVSWMSPSKVNLHSTLTICSLHSLRNSLNHLPKSVSLLKYCVWRNIRGKIEYKRQSFNQKQWNHVTLKVRGK